MDYREGLESIDHHVTAILDILRRLEEFCSKEEKDCENCPVGDWCLLLHELQVELQTDTEKLWVKVSAAKRLLQEIQSHL